MDRLTLKAVVTATDQGIFTAVISTENVDREGDVVLADAMVKALQKWNRPIPLTWHHSTKAEDVFGSIDPVSARAANREVVVDGTVDMESERGRQAWPLMKARSLGFSFGYMVPEGGSKANGNGGRDITEVDVFEVTGTITPMNNDTRVVDTKGLTPVNVITGLGPSKPDEADGEQESQNAHEASAQTRAMDEADLELRKQSYAFMHKHLMGGSNDVQRT